jgi:hypothetical protein
MAFPTSQNTDSPFACALGTSSLGSYPPQHHSEPLSGLRVPSPVPPTFPDSSSPDGVRSLRSHSRRVPLAPCPRPRLTHKIVPGPFFSLLPRHLPPCPLLPPPKKQLNHLSQLKHLPLKRHFSPISPCPPLDSILILSKGARTGRGRVPACKVWGTDLLSDLPTPAQGPRAVSGDRARWTRRAQQSLLAAPQRQLQTVALRSGEAARKPGPGQGGGRGCGQGCLRRPRELSFPTHTPPVGLPAIGCLQSDHCLTWSRQLTAGTEPPPRGCSGGCRRRGVKGPEDRAALPPPPPPPSPLLQGAQLPAYCQRGR